MSARTRRALLCALAAFAMFAALVGVRASAAQAAPVSLWGATVTPGIPVDEDAQAVELGVRFRSDVAGTVTGVRFWKGSTANGGTHTGSLWTTGGQRLARATFTGETASGWQSVRFATPVAITAGRSYIASYFAPRGRYSATTGYFTQQHNAAPLRAPASTSSAPNGVYRYGSSGGFPTQTWQAANYWVDVLFVPSGSPSPSPSPSVTPSASPSPTGSPSSSPTPTPTQPPGDLPLIPWEGGPAYYGAYPAAAAWTDPAFFPIGVWFESVLTQSDVDKDKAAGLNTYVELTSNSDRALIRNNGMWAIVGGPGTENVGDLLADEADMLYGPGNDGWTGQDGWNTCIPTQDQGGRCGYTVMSRRLSESTPGNGRIKYANYGKGVAMWESDAEAGQFVNAYTSAVSVDMYFYTDPNLYGGECATWLSIPQSECRMAANYGAVVRDVRRLDALDGVRQPVYGFVEVGHPFTEASAPTITGPQIQGAVVSSLIGGARGIIYFNHNFGGPCISQHVLRDACGAAVRPYVTEINARIRDLAPVLNTQSYAWDFGPGLDTMLKRGPDGWYLFAMQSRPGRAGTYTFTLPPGFGSTVTALYEGRTVPVVGGQFSDSFAGESAYHIYKIT